MRLVTFLARLRFVVALVGLFLSVPAWAGDTPRDRATLKGIHSLQVGVEKMSPDAEQDGLTRSQIKADIESRLRHSGIQVDPANPYLLYVAINTVRDPESSSYVFNISVTFHQGVRLPRSPESLHLATTWSVSHVGRVGVARLADVRPLVIASVDKFITAYLEQNPKK